MTQFGSKSTIDRGGLISRAFILLVVFIAVAFWPEEFSTSAVLRACALATAVVFVCSTIFCRIFLHSFVASSVVAYAVYAVTAPVGDFSVASQSVGSASDSQFFLFESRRFIYEGNIDALFSTWGSLVPVVFGSGALLSFSGNYIGIVFFNSLLYSFSVLLSSKILKLSDSTSKFLPLFGWMPLQAFYNSMLSKEPIYIFLIIVSVYIFTRKNVTCRMLCFQLLIYLISMSACMLLRPAAAIVLAFISIIYLFVESRIRNVIYFIIGYTFIFIGIISLSDYIGFHLPINFNIEVFDQQKEIFDRAASEKDLGSNVTWLITPPFSILFSPVLGTLWMVSPLPLIGSLVEKIYLVFSGIVTFQTLAIIIRYMDAALMVTLLVVGLIRRRHLRSVIFNPLILIALILLLVTVMFQFLESGRHRYFPGFVLAMAVLAASYPSIPRR